MVWLSCFPVGLVDLTPNGPLEFHYHTLVMVADLALLGAIVVATRRGKLPLLAALAGVVLVTLALGFVFHPSIRGSQALFRWGGVVAIAALAERRTMIALGGGWAVFESVLALGQRVRGESIGLAALGEFDFPFVRFGDALAPQGTLIHPYLLAGLALLGGALLAGAARERRWLLLPAAIAVAPVGMTYCRSALVGLALVLLCFAVGRFPAAVLALAIGAGLPALVWSNGWVERTRASTASSSLRSVDTGRSTLMRQAGGLVADHPLTGVGPGRYVSALREKDVDTTHTGGQFRPVHNVPMFAAAEGGIAAGLAMATLLLVAGVMAWRGGPAAMAIFAALLPFWMLDHFPYTFPQGLVMTGLWLGAVSSAGRAHRRERRECGGDRRYEEEARLTARRVGPARPSSVS